MESDAYARLFGAAQAGVFSGTLLPSDSTLVANPFLKQIFGYAADAAEADVHPFAAERFLEADARRAFLDRLDAQKQVTEAKLTVSVGGKPYGEMRPAKWAFKKHEDEPPTTEVHIERTMKEDLYLVLNGYESSENGGIANLICASGFTQATTKSRSLHTATPVAL